MSKKRILLVASYDGSLIEFRGDFIEHLIKNNFDVYAAAPDFSEEYSRKIQDLGAFPVEFHLQRSGLNPKKDLKSIEQLKIIIREKRIDLVFPYTVKPVIYASIAANSCNVPVISLITGLGYAFSRISTKTKLLQNFNEMLYRFSIRKNKIIVFQNNDDYQLLLDRKVISKKQKVAFVSGSGVNLDQFYFKEKDYNEKVSFLLIARLIEEKGISLYMKAAKILKAKYPSSTFHLIGPTETTPSAISEDKINLLNNAGVIIYHGHQSNIREHFHNNDVFVLPSYYREGLPRTSLEACACGNPIITTDSVGCREAVREGENGFLIEPRNLEALITSMEYFILNPNQIKEMGFNSRKYAEERFDVKIINNDLVKLIKSVI